MDELMDLAAQDKSADFATHFTTAIIITDTAQFAWRSVYI